MGAALSFMGFGAATSVVTWAAACFSGAACSLFTKSCNCNNSVATRVGYAILFLLNSMLAWIMTSDWAIKQLQHITYDYLKLNCPSGECYGLLAVHRVCFALTLFHTILACILIGVHDSRNKRAAIQNGWWGPKVLAWLSLLVVTFFIPHGFFSFWGKYVALIGAAVFILFGLILLVDFAHTWTEGCLERWEMAESNFWKYVLIGGTLFMYLGAITLTGLMYGFFAGSGCRLNQFFISLNLVFAILLTAMSVLPAVQEVNPRSGLSQSAIVIIYCTYLVLSAVVNEPKDPNGGCNGFDQLHGSRTTSIVLGAVFTFLAIAYSTSRAATQGKALISSPSGEYQQVAQDNVPLVNNQQPSGVNARHDALVAAVERGALPASALHDDDDDEDETDVKDDEKQGCAYNYSFFHGIFAIAAMYVAMLLTNWNTLESGTEEDLVRVGQSYAAMWVKVVSSWICVGLYGWTLVAPLVMPDRFLEYY
ncbi:uncharacterized protein VTP21DRAFT_9535 [Calcarisporiella thermophila]|uniref:uncharacterized protein n=1 Tax=Calcarisporiella thermophila TaxID=911321 RepID=UPI0037430A3E